MRDACRHVQADRLESGLRHVAHGVEVLVARRRAGGPREVVHRRGVHARLREAQGELLVERVEPTYVGQDDDAGTRLNRAARAE